VNIGVGVGLAALWPTENKQYTRNNITLDTILDPYFLETKKDFEMMKCKIISNFGTMSLKNYKILDLDLE
jgi:hypothetical protein